MELFSKMEIITMASVLGGMILIIAFLTILDMVDERKSKKRAKLQKNANEECEEVINQAVTVATVSVMATVVDKEIEEIEVLDFDEPIIEMKEECANNEVILEEIEEVKFEVPSNYENNTRYQENIIVITDERQRAKEELARLEEELQKDEDFSNTITNFELEQEENAIISYDELMMVSDRLYNQNEVVQYDDGDEPITIDEVIKRFSNTEMVFENTANYDKLNKELEKKEQNLINVYESK